MEEFTANVIKIIQNIPEGKVMSYGQIGKFAGKSRGARQVSWILHSMSKKYHLPWHRVVNAQGKISHTGSEQKELLLMEDVEFDLYGKIKMEKHLHEL